MSKPDQKKNKYLHDVKGPATLTADVIADIVNNRPLKGGRKILADKYGISEKRVLNIWKDYYGGTTLKDHASGLKKPLPVDAVKTSDITTRKFKSERGLYTAKEPKIMDKPDAKAKVVRKVAPQRKLAVGNDLDLDNVESMTDAQARIINGEVLSGNNSPELLQAIASLIENNHHITERMVKSLESTLERVSNNSVNTNNNDDYDSDSDNIDTDTNDDSTAVTKRKYTKKLKERPKAKPIRRGEVVSAASDEEYEDSYENTLGGSTGYSEPVADYRGASYGGRAADNVHPPNMGRIHEHMGNNQRSGVQPPRSGDRARAIYRTERRGSSGRLEEADLVSDPRYESQIPPAEYDGGKKSIQPNNTYNNYQQYPQSAQGIGIPSQSGTGFSQAVPGISWLSKRKI